MSYSLELIWMQNRRGPLLARCYMAKPSAGRRPKAGILPIDPHFLIASLEL